MYLSWLNLTFFISTGVGVTAAGKDDDQTKGHRVRAMARKIYGTWYPTPGIDIRTSPLGIKLDVPSSDKRMFLSTSCWALLFTP
jgi:hypothetical protein